MASDQEKLKEAMASDQEKKLMLDKNKKGVSKEGSANGKDGSEEEESEESEDEEDEEAFNEQRGDVSLPKKAGEGSLNDDKDLKSIGSQEFIAKKPEGVSFGLHTPKIKRPQLNLPVPPVEAPVEDSALSTRRPGAAAFFGDGSGGNTTVPLPPSAGYSLEESDGE